MAITRIKTSNITDGTIVDADIAGMAASKLTGALPAISGASLTGISTDTSRLEYNQAILAFKLAAQNSLARFQMVDQVIDEYQDATGIDAGASTGELFLGSGIAKYYSGSATVTPTTSSVGSIASTGTVDGDYTYYKWTTVASNHTFTTNTAQDYEYLVLAGGGGGGSDVGSRAGGGGGAGGYLTASGFAVAATTITGITVGAGGATDTNGSNSVFSTITSYGGGGGGGASPTNDVGNVGGSGGGGENALGGAASPAGQGYGGGTGSYSGKYAGGGGGGAGQVGFSSNATTDWAVGGYGLTSSIDGTSTQRGGGGGGGKSDTNYSDTTSGGAGGGGHGGDRNTSSAPTVGTANTGGGGGGGSYPSGSTYQTGAVGGSGIVIIRRLTLAVGGGGNLTLQSVATTAESAPTKADLVVLIEDSSGTATVNTDIKAKVSRNGSAFSGYVTFVDEGDWGTNKRILVAREVDISGITSGTSMKYKIETLNQSAGSKETRIHATSLAWS